MKLILMLAASVICGIGGSGGARADDVPALLEAHKCYACHADRDARTGPAFADVAQHYRGRPGAAATLVAVIRDGSRSGGPWHMPPHPEVSVGDANAMVHYILALKPGAG